MVYIPEKGERVRVIEVDPLDPTPEHKVGEVVTVEGEPCQVGKWLWLTNWGSGTYCKVVPVEGIERVEGLDATDGTRVPLEAVPIPPFMSTDSATRKLMPVAMGFLKYFPDAVMCVAWVSRAGNEKHNPGSPLHWDKSKSADEPDAEVRHMLDGFRGLPPDPGLEPLAHLGHLASKAWRANADLQRACDEARAAYERGEEWRE